MLLALLAATGKSSAQGLLDGADWFERDLGEGVTWRYYLFDDLFGAMQSVSYVEADLTNPAVSIEFPYLVTGREKISSMIPDQHPDSVAGINGTYFDTSVGGHRTYLRVNGSVIPPPGSLFSPWGYEAALALDNSGNASIEQIPGGGWGDDTTHPDILACGPLIIENGTVPSAALNSIGAHCTARHPRSAVGITNDNRLIMFTVDGRTEMSAGMTCEELGIIMEELGCDDAFNLDGGGSTSLWGAGELYQGILNYPSDNGTFDHEGERSCSNAIAIESAPANPKLWDARLISKNYMQTMGIAEAQTVSLVYENIGTSTWTAADTKVVLSRPDSRTSPFYDSDTWPSESQPAVMTPATVAPGQTGTFSFVMQAPDISGSADYDEHFMLTQSGVGRIGPPDNEAWMPILVQAPLYPEQDFIVESRPGGQYHGWYTDSGMANTSVNCTAPGTTTNIGSRYGSTYRSVAGSKNATVTPDFPEAALYNVYVAWPEGSSRRTPITYHVNSVGQTQTFQLDQTATANEWIQLGSSPYLFAKGTSGSVVMTNEDIDVSGSMYASAVKFEYIAPGESDKEYKVNYLSPADAKPVIDGVREVSEWDAASALATGFVAHNNTAVSATEDGSFQMLYDQNYLYILFQMQNAYLAEYPAPPSSYGFSDLPGDKINFYMTPYGVSTQPFYRIMLSPNPLNEICYEWSQANITKTSNANEGVDWIPNGEAAYGYVDGALTIEYRIPWSAFDYEDMVFTSAPADGTVWGVQPGLSNEVSSGVWEYVNWEPDETPGYVMGEPFGTLEFVQASLNVHGWIQY